MGKSGGKEVENSVRIMSVGGPSKDYLETVTA